MSPQKGVRGVYPPSKGVGVSPRRGGVGYKGPKPSIKGRNHRPRRGGVGGHPPIESERGKGGGAGMGVKKLKSFC